MEPGEKTKSEKQNPDDKPGNDAEAKPEPNHARPQSERKSTAGELNAQREWRQATKDQPQLREEWNEDSKNNEQPKPLGFVWRRKRLEKNRHGHTPNETEVSCGERKRTSSAKKRFSSCQMLIAGLLAVSSNDWLAAGARLLISSASVHALDRTPSPDAVFGNP
jgi:hypothetical protein